MPPTQMPRRFEAASLSRMRSPVTSRSNWAKDNSMLRVSRPMLVVVLKDWVTETNETPSASKISTSLAKSASERVSRSTLYTTTTSICLERIAASRRCIAGLSREPPEKPPSSKLSLIKRQPSWAWLFTYAAMRQQMLWQTVLHRTVEFAEEGQHPLSLLRLVGVGSGSQGRGRSHRAGRGVRDRG